MNVIHPHCAGLDVHKKTVVACAYTPGPDGQGRRELRTFGTMTAELLALADWLEARGVTDVAMESTGVYWQPVYHLLDGRFTLLVVNAQHLKHVEGRKTDVKDAEWIARLLQCGLLSPSFIPPTPIRELRELTRLRTQLVRDKAAVANRIQKVLEGANIKLGSVASDVLGASGRAMIAALIRGESDPATLADCARGSLRTKRDRLVPALQGRVTEHHRFLLRALMDQVRHLEDQIERYTARVAEVIAPFEAEVGRLMTLPGVGRQAAEVIVAEIGVDMTKFPSAGHLASWAGLCPGNDQSAGKRRSGKTTKGSQWLRATLVQAAWAASHTKATVFSVVYRKWARRLGKKKALVAVARKILVVAYHLLKAREDYRELHAPAQAA